LDIFLGLGEVVCDGGEKTLELVSMDVSVVATFFSEPLLDFFFDLWFLDDRLSSEYLETDLVDGDTDLDILDWFMLGDPEP